MTTNLIGSIGKRHSAVLFDHEHYGYLSGNVVSVYNVSRGPKDFIWLPTTGINAIDTHVKSQKVAISSLLSSYYIDIMDFSTQSVVCRLTNPSNVAAISLSFSCDASHLIALCGTNNQYIVCWNLISNQLLFSWKVPKVTPFSHCSFSPCSNEYFCLYGDSNIRFDCIDDTLGIYSVDSSELPNSSNGYHFLCWLPSNVALLNDPITGIVVSYNSKSKLLSTLGSIKNPAGGSFIPTTCVVTLDSIVFGSESGDIVWLNVNFTLLIKMVDNIEITDVILIDSISQHISLSSGVDFIFPLDSEYESCIVGLENSTTVYMPIKIIQTLPTDVDDSNTTVSTITSLPSTVATTLYESIPTAIVLISSCSVPITKHEYDDTYLTCYITVSSVGELIFWKTPSADTGFSKRAVPEQFQKILSIPNERAGTVTSIKFNVMSPGRKANILLGYSDGYFEVFKLSVNELEEDDAFNYNCRLHNGLYEDDGSVYLLEMTSSYLMRIFANPLNIISCDNLGSHIACSSYQCEELYVLKWFSSTKVNVVQRLSIGEEEVIAITWSSNDTYVAVFTKSGNVMCYYNDCINDNLGVLKSPNCTFKVMPHYFGIPISLSKNRILYQTYCPDNAIACLQLPESLESASGTDILYIDGVSVNAIRLDSPIISMEISGNLLVLGSINGEVSVWSLNEDDLESSSLMYKYRPHTDAVVAVKVSFNGRSFLSSSCDGSYFISRCEGSSGKTAVDIRADNTKNESKKNTGVSSTWSDAYMKEEIGKLIQRHKDNVHEIIDNLMILQKEIKHIVIDNIKRDEFEQVSRSEMVLDIEAEQQCLVATDDIKTTLEEKYDDYIHTTELVAARYRNLCFDLFESRSSQMVNIAFENMSSPSSIASYSLRQLGDYEKFCISGIKRLRAIELKSKRYYNDGYEAIYSDSSRAVKNNWIIESKRLNNTNEDRSKDNVLTSAHKHEEDDDSSIASQNTEVDTYKSLLTNDLLYPSLSIRTQIQKKAQLYMLIDMDCIARREFNNEYYRIKDEKSNIISQVNARLKRIQEIQQDLHGIDESQRLTLEREEIDDSCIRIIDADLQSSPYETESSRLKREAEELSQRNAVLLASEKDTKGRALRDMMDGKLEAKSSILPEKEEVAITTIDTIANNNQQKIDESDAQMKVLMEEKLKYRKSIEQESKKLKVEVIDFIRIFNESFDSANIKKKVLFQNLLVNEVLCTMVAKSIASKDFTWYSFLEVNYRMIESEVSSSDVYKRIKSVKLCIDEMTQKISILQEEEKSLDKSFKRDIQVLCNATFDQETLKVFTQLFRLRLYQSYSGESALLDFTGTESERNGDERDSSRASQMSKDYSGKSKTSRVSRRNSHRASDGRQSKLGRSKLKMSKGIESNDVKESALGPMQEAAKALRGGDTKEEVKDAYQIAVLYNNKMKRSTMIAIPLNYQLRMEVDCPEGFNIEKFAWSKLQELRSARIEKEIQTKSLTNDLSHLKLKLDVYRTRELDAEEGQLKIVTLRNSLRSQLYDNEADFEVLINLVQGQDEVLRNCRVSEYDGALLLPSKVVQMFNNRIIELGGNKTTVLSKTKLFRRKNNIVDWKVEHLELLKNHLIEYYRDLQLLRVTKDLQQVLREGCVADLAKNKVVKFATRKEFLINDATNRQRQLQELKSSLQKNLYSIRDEVQVLESTISDISNQVVSRRIIKANRDSARGRSNDSKEAAAMKMRSVTSRRQLVNFAKGQSEEIDFLRQELDRLRQRTFPSFVRYARHRSKTSV